MFQGMTRNKWLAVIIGFKLVLVLAVVGIVTDGLYFGDKTVRGEDKNKNEKSADKKAVAKDNDKSDKTSEKAKPSDKIAEEKNKEKRRSFLDDLLNLPDVNRDEPKKEEIGRYLSLAEKKGQQIGDRMALLKKREDQLIRLEQSIDDKLQRLDEERRFFSETLQREKDLKGKRVDHLVKLYSKMEPKKAAPVIEKLDKDLVVALFAALPQKQVTSILEGMNPQKSVELTEYYGRVRSGREYDLLKELNASLKQEFQECKGMPDDRFASNGIEPKEEKVTSDAKAPDTTAKKETAAKETPAVEPQPNATRAPAKPEEKPAH